MEPFDYVQEIVHEGPGLAEGIAAYCQSMRLNGGPAQWGEVAEVDYMQEFADLRDYILRGLKALPEGHQALYLCMAEYVDEDDDSTLIAFEPRGLAKFDPKGNDLIEDSAPLLGAEQDSYVPDPLVAALKIKAKKGKPVADNYAFPLLYMGLLTVEVLRSPEAAALPARTGAVQVVVGHEEGDWLPVGTWSGGRLVLGV